MEAAGIGTFGSDLVSGVLERDDRLVAVFGDDATPAAHGLETFTRHGHSEDRDDVVAAVQRAVDTRGGFDALYRVLLPGGASRWISARGRILSDATGAATRLLGAASDVTTIDLTSYRASQRRLPRIRSTAATTRAGSPGRRGSMTGSAQSCVAVPVTDRMTDTISRTETPCPRPMLAVTLPSRSSWAARDVGRGDVRDVHEIAHARASEVS
jgi:hypothetical protein